VKPYIGKPCLISGAAAGVMLTKAIAIENVARVIATVHMSPCHCDVESRRGVKYWEIIADNLKKAGSSLGLRCSDGL
jgi:hypothetical protein